VGTYDWSSVAVVDGAVSWNFTELLLLFSLPALLLPSLGTLDEDILSGA